MSAEGATRIVSCLNCDKDVTQNDVYCSQCSQRLRESKISVWQLLRDFVEGFFNWDSRLLVTIRQLWRPGYLTKQYMIGKRLTYLNPVRLFLFIMVIHFGLLALLINFGSLNLNDNREFGRWVRSQTAEQFDSLATAYALDRIEERHRLDSVRKHLFKSSDVLTQGTFLGSSTMDALGVNLANKDILINDVYELSEAEVLEKYKVTGFWDRLLVRQSIKTTKDRKGALQYLFGNLIWAVILTIVILALVMKLLYIRHRRFYVEHFVFLLHFHSFSFVLISLIVLWRVLVFDIPAFSRPFELIVASVIPIFLFLAMKRYYQQGFFKTVFKFFAFSLGYFTILLTLISVVTLAGLLLF